MSIKTDNKSANRVARRWLGHLREAGRQRTAMDEVQMISGIFQGVMPHVKDWHRFIKSVREDLDNMRLWERLVVDLDVDSEVISTGSEIFGSERHDDKVDYATEMSMKMTLNLGLKLLPKVFLQQYRSLVLNSEGFLQALSGLLLNHNSVVMLGKLFAKKFNEALVEDPGSTLEGISEDGQGKWPTARDHVEITAQDISPSYVKVDYHMSGATMSPPTVKATPTGVVLTFEGTLKMDAFDFTFEKQY